MREVVCEKCGKTVPEEKCVCVKMQVPKRVTAETYKTTYETTKWMTDDRWMICRRCYERLTEWMYGR